MEFQNGKIYTIRSHQTNKYYIGSTNQLTLAQRLGKHRGNYKDYLNNNNGYMSSFEILQYTDHYIELLELYPFNNKDELQHREGELIRQYKSDVVNIRIAGGKTVEQMVEYNKHYRVNNKQVIVERNKQQYINNKQQILEQMKQTIICECGLTITKYSKQRHMRTLKHINLINQQLFNNELNHYNF